MSFKQDRAKPPVLTVGKYSGVSIDKVPMSYLRWMILQDFPKEWVEFAKKKLSKSDYNNSQLEVSRHALDMFSKRFSSRWAQHMIETADRGDGIATYVTKLAQTAWDRGMDISKHRHQDDGITKEWEGIRWVFMVSPHFSEYKQVITIMEAD